MRGPRLIWILGLYPTFLTTQLGVSTGESALALSFVGVGGLAGLLGGWIGDRINQRILLIVSTAVMAVLGVLIYVVQATFAWQCVFACLMGVFGTGVFFPNTNSVIQRAVRPHRGASRRAVRHLLLRLRSFFRPAVRSAGASIRLAGSRAAASHRTAAGCGCHHADRSDIAVQQRAARSRPMILAVRPKGEPRLTPISRTSQLAR